MSKTKPSGTIGVKQPSGKVLKHPTFKITDAMREMTEAIRAAREFGVTKVRPHGDRLGGVQAGGPVIWNGKEWR